MMNVDNAASGLSAANEDVWRGQLARCGRGVRIRASRVLIGSDVVLEDDVTLVGDEIFLEAGTIISQGCDLRAGVLQLGSDCRVGSRSSVCVADVFRLGAASRVDDGASVVCRRFETGKAFFVGDHFVVGAGGTLESTAEVAIGDRVALGSHCVLNANQPIRLANQVGSGDSLTIWTSGFHFGHSIVEGYTPTFEPVTVGENVWLAYHVTLLPGVTIGRNTIVAAGAVVTRDLPADCLAAGAPAAVRRQLEARSRTEDELLPVVADLLGKWGRELIWKGWAVTPTRPGWLEITAADGRLGQVCLLPSSASAPRRVRDLLVTVSIDERNDVDCDDSSVLLSLRSRSYRGGSFDLAEDLRDFLRRRTVPCGDQRPFRAIVPVAFERLRKAL